MITIFGKKYWFVTDDISLTLSKINNPKVTFAFIVFTYKPLTKKGAKAKLSDYHNILPAKSNNWETN